MLQDPVIEDAVAYIRSLFQGNSDGHDFDHSVRVWRNAVRIARTEPACDMRAVELGALLHDTDDPKLFHTEGNAHARAFLKEHGAKTCFMLGCDRGTSFGAYQRIQTLLNQIYVEVRAEKARELYGKPLSDLSEDELSAIQGLYPISVLETQMKG